MEDELGKIGCCCCCCCGGGGGGGGGWESESDASPSENPQFALEEAVDPPQIPLDFTEFVTDTSLIEVAPPPPKRAEESPHNDPEEDEEGSP